MDSIEKIEVGGKAKVDIGAEMIDVRIVTVEEIDSENETLKVTLPGENMMGPYTVPFSRVQERA